MFRIPWRLLGYLDQRWLHSPISELFRQTRKSPVFPRSHRQPHRAEKCRLPGCEHTRFLHAHHVVHWANGGETSLDNLMPLCARHHRLVHEFRYGVKSTEDRFEFRDSESRVIPPTGEGRFRGNVSVLTAENAARGVDVGSTTFMAKDGGRLGYDLFFWLMGLPKSQHTYS